jgi:hypothetical protein
MSAMRFHMRASIVSHSLDVPSALNRAVTNVVDNGVKNGRAVVVARCWLALHERRT